jgi:hypothetical protein
MKETYEITRVLNDGDKLTTTDYVSKKFVLDLVAEYRQLVPSTYRTVILTTTKENPDWIEKNQESKRKLRFL